MEGGAINRESLKKLLMRVADARPTLPLKLRLIADYTLSHPTDVALHSISHVAKSAEVYPSAVIRFAKRFGFTGFPEMQKVFKSQLTEIQFQTDACTKGDVVDLGKPSISTFQSSLLRTAKTLEIVAQNTSGARFHCAIRYLAEAATIHLVGTQRELPVLIALERSLLLLGVNAKVCGLSTGVKEEIRARATPEDTILMVHFSALSSDTDLFEAMCETGAKIIAITTYSPSPSSRAINCWFDLTERSLPLLNEELVPVTASFCLSLTAAALQKKNKNSLLNEK